MKVLVTGGSGFIGTNIVEYYVRRGCKVLNLDIAPPRNPDHAECWKKIDITHVDELCRIVLAYSPDVIMHMAARTDLGGRSLEDYKSNTDGVKAVIEAAAQLPALERVIFASSMLVCALGHMPQGDEDYCPTTAYGQSKVVGEKLVRSFANNFAWTIVRPTSLWGPWFDVPYRKFFDAVSARLYIHPKGRRVLRTYGFVGNAVHQLDRLASSKDTECVNGKVFYLGDYAPTEVYEWAHLISAQFGVKPPREVPLQVLKVLAKAGDVAKQLGMVNPPLTSFRLENLLTEAAFDMRSLEKVAGPLPYDLEEGVKITVEWIRTRGAGFRLPE